MKSPGQEDIPESLAEEFGRRRVREVSESSGRLPPNAKYWLPNEGITAASAFRFLCVCACVEKVKTWKEHIQESKLGPKFF